MTDRDNICRGIGIDQHAVAKEHTLHRNVALIVIQEHDTAYFAASCFQEHGISRAGADDLYAFCRQLIDGGLDNGALFVSEKPILAGVGI